MKNLPSTNGSFYNLIYAVHQLQKCEKCCLHITQKAAKLQILNHKASHRHIPTYNQSHISKTNQHNKINHQTKPVKIKSNGKLKTQEPQFQT